MFTESADALPASLRLAVSTGINTAVNRLRKSLNDNPEKPIYIATVIGLGYRFVAKVEAFTVPFGAGKGRRATDVSNGRAAETAPNPVEPGPPRPIALSGGSLVTMPPRSNAALYLLPPVEPAPASEPAPEPAPQPAIAVPPIRTFWTMSWSLRVAIVLLLVATDATVWQYRERVALKAAEQAAEIPSADDDLVVATFNESDGEARTRPSEACPPATAAALPSPR